MRILVVGSGGREHALAWALAGSESVTHVASLPGNPGLAGIGPCHPGSPGDADRVLEVTRADGTDLVVVGPEAPLAAGLVDHLEANGTPAFGPRRDAARIEASKIFARQFMERHGIPGAAFEVFTDAGAAREYLATIDAPCVVKADGLAAGKGAIVCATREEAGAAVTEMLVTSAFGDAGRRIVVEECLVGEEVSVFALCDGERAVPLMSSQDHKAIHEGDRGPNTGGMGAYAPWPGATDAFMSEVMTRIIEPTVRGLAEEGMPYRGCLYAGLMVTADGPRVIEFNCRFGDPEAQVVLPLLEEDLGQLLLASATGQLETRSLRWRDGAALAVVLASPGYPGSYPKGLPIEGIETAESDEEVIVFHAGTADVDGRLVTAGGRVLAVTARGPSLVEARDRAYGAADHVTFEGAYKRRDIGAKGLQHVKG